MLIENRWNIILRRLWASQLPSICLGVLHAAFYSRTDHGQFQLRKDCAHLDECLAHRIDVAALAVDGDAADNDQAEALGLDDVHDLAQLFCAAAQSAGPS